MGSDYRTERVDPPWRIQEFAHGHDGQQRRHLPAHAYEAPPRKEPHSTADVAQVLGLPAESVTPQMIDAVVPLLAEIDRLHWLADQAEHRANWAERQSDRHSLVPCLTRRAFVREVDALLGGGDANGTLAVIHVSGVENLRLVHGLAAGDGALRHIAGNIIGALRASDVIGCLSGSDFGILLAGTPVDQARIKVEEILGRIDHPQYSWDGQLIALIPSFGLHALASGDSAELALAAADLARRSGQA
ncbi:MAG TPA: diguanylate cyclase [Magnetospirillum sp.]|jgi:GGDEF domain-containing protein|nr:diguanylate cyclase [Magnetospirillum sp.]